jgi:hypothetical protein
MQMDSFLEDGSHEATIAVVRSLSVAIPLTTPSLRDYLLQKLVMLSGAPMPSAKLARRREKVDVICEAVRALDATGTFLIETHIYGDAPECFSPSIRKVINPSDP